MTTTFPVRTSRRLPVPGGRVLGALAALALLLATGPGAGAVSSPAQAGKKPATQPSVAAKPATQPSIAARPATQPSVAKPATQPSIAAKPAPATKPASPDARPPAMREALAKMGLATSQPTTRPAPRPFPTFAATGPKLTPPAAVAKPVPETMEDLRALQEQVKKVVARVAPTVVGLRVGGGQGSGVIISEDGYVLTAGHVAGSPGRDVTVLLHDGKPVKGKSLGVNYGIDSGLVKITDPSPLPGGKWPVAEIGQSSPLRRGQYCIALGHPGGYKPSRTPPLRLGRILTSTANIVRTDCTLVGGDSGGPLFDLEGRVIGIHSRIGNGITENVHVPADTYRDTWERLAAGESWGLPAFAMAQRPGGPYLGIQCDQAAPECRVIDVMPDSPAAKAGIQAGDVLTRMDNERVANFSEFLLRLGKKRPDDTANIEVTRDGKTVKLKATIGRRPAN